MVSGLSIDSTLTLHISQQSQILKKLDFLHFKSHGKRKSDNFRSLKIASIGKL